MSEKPDRPHAGDWAFTRVDLLALLASLALLLFVIVLIFSSDSIKSLSKLGI